MNDLQITHRPVAEAGMLIRKPVAEVFEAFVDPTVTTKFWFSKSSGPLEPGQHVRWDWEMYGASTELNVKAVEENRRILIEWGDPPTDVEWSFMPRDGNATFVGITNSGFHGGGDEVVSQAMDSVGGFTLVLAGLKALLEYGVALNLVPDRHPELIVTR